MLEATIKRIVKRLYPELTGGLHLPQWGEVINEPVPINAAAISSEDDPRYCVDVQLLNADGKHDAAMPIMQKVPLPATGSGDQRGVFIFPRPGAIVELGFIMGMPHRPFIRSIFVRNQIMPTLGTTDALMIKDEFNYYRIDGDNNDILEKCQRIAERFADVKQRVIVKDGGKVWLGNETSNVLRILDDLINLVSDIANTAASHTHTGDSGGNTSPPNQAATFSNQADSADTLDTELAPIVDA